MAIPAEGARCGGREDVLLGRPVATTESPAPLLGCTGVAAVVTEVVADGDVGVAGVGVAEVGGDCGVVAGEGGMASPPAAPGSISTSTVSMATLLRGVSSGIG